MWGVWTPLCENLSSHGLGFLPDHRPVVGVDPPFSPSCPQPLFQGVDLLVGGDGDGGDGARFLGDPLRRGPSCLPSDGRENFFGASSRVALAGAEQVERQRVASRMRSARAAAQKQAEVGLDAEARDKADRKEARRLMKQEKQRAAAAEAELGDLKAALHEDHARVLELRQRALAASRAGLPGGGGGGGGSGSGSGGGERTHRPCPPNSGRVLYDDGRWTFIPNLHSLPGPKAMSSESLPKATRKR
jgi:hypothetical protein